MNRLGYLTAVLSLLAWAPPALARSTIPFVGCIETDPIPTDGGWTAPSGKPLFTSLPAAQAAGLAVYASNWSAVLAPRGWVCRSTVVPLQGVAMIVSPEPKPGSGNTVLAGPLVILWNDQRPATVAAYAGRYFPDAVVGVQPAAASPALPRYPADRMHYRQPHVLEYFTPAGRPGLGSQVGARGGVSSLPAYGVLALSSLPRGEGGIVNLTIRLPPSLAALHGAIMKTFETCLPNDNLVGCESQHSFVGQGHPIDDGD